MAKSGKILNNYNEQETKKTKKDSYNFRKIRRNKRNIWVSN